MNLARTLSDQGGVPTVARAEPRVSDNNLFGAHCLG